MGDGKIHIPGKKRKPLQAGQAPIIRISVEAYNTLVDICNESTLSMSEGAELTIMNGNERIISAAHRVNRRLANIYKEYEEDIKDEA